MNKFAHRNQFRANPGSNNGYIRKKTRRIQWSKNNFTNPNPNLTNDRERRPFANLGGFSKITLPKVNRSYYMG